MRQTLLPARPGVGFKPEHFSEIDRERQPLGFFEVHAENYMGAGGPPHARLTKLRQDYALSVHGVGLSIGGADPLDREHLARLKTVCDRYQPESFSEHLAWSSHGENFYNDLLPLPYNQSTLDSVIRHVDQVQEVLGRRMLLENPATYLLFEASDIEETEFLSEIARRTGCGLLLDINNVFVAAANHNLDPRAYLARFPLAHVGEIHLSGHSETEDEHGAALLIDSHDTPVKDPVWTLYRETIAKTGPLPTLIEWDNDVPDWATLRAEAMAAGAILDRARALAA
ncbi:uncharacterized protein (UPF0276 family) [Rhizobium sp. SG_E_25_P2]|uniref:MNIO family bufferin maturase n=1 Tax=Rhizobium sp. SG_E_25_P2 TaxID=2879942 RepID=UPI002474972A|nr:DUF692 domain-containing protein [Rhizobium sp. SG_E_25_P2]MDH6268420.1 uncharacterized protein (UPF0276 family) [Rhizobium sp. SG_E_25_P2]